MSVPAAAAPPRRRRKEARPAEIVAAALQTFTEKGFAATRLDEVAARAGVSKGTLYLYFPNKEELFKAMVRQTVLPNLGGLESFVADYQGDTAALLEELFGRIAVLFATTAIGRIPKIIIAESATFPDLAQFWVREFVERGKTLLAGILERGVAAGEFSPVQRESVFVLFAPMLLLALWNNAIGPAVGQSLDPARMAGEATRLLLNGLRVREQRP